MKIATTTGFALSLLASAGAAEPGLDLGWMTGHWCSSSGESRIEELWLASPGEVMLGLNQTVASGRTTAFEYLRIVVDADQGADYIAQPGGRPPTAFHLTDVGQNWVRFENPGHDFPQKIEYRRIGEVLYAEVSGPKSDGSVMSLPFEFSPCALSGAPDAAPTDRDD